MASEGEDSLRGLESDRELRLHPISWVFLTCASSKGLIGPWVLLALFSGGSNLELLSVIFVFPALISALLRYAVFRYRLGPEEMVIRDGILTRNERHIPYSRIQNIDLVQNPFHRFFGVALVRLETASGGRPEAVMRVLSLAAVEQMQQRVSARRSQADEPSEGETLLRLPDLELVRLGLISNRGMLLLAALTGVFWQVSGWEQRIESLAPELFDRIQAGTGGFSLWWALLAILALLALLRIFSVLWYLFTLRGFRLRLGERDLRTEYGLLNRVSATIPLRRIQLISSQESPLHRLFGRVSLRLETAGSVGEEGRGNSFDTRTEAPWLAPVLPRERLSELLRAVQPEIDLDSLQWQPLAAGAERRLLKKALILVALATAVLWPTAGRWSLLAAATGVPWALLHARLYVRHTSFAVSEWGVAFRSGWWMRRLSVLRFAKCQSVQLSQTPFDRRHRMASLQADTAGAGKLNHRIDIPYLNRDLAQTLQHQIYREASRTRFAW